MRVTSMSAFDASVTQLQRRQEALSTAQQQLTSGKRVLQASDDPAAAARAERALAAASRSQARMRALDASHETVQLTESALGDANELLQQARDLVVSAGNGSYTDAERRTVAEAVRGLRNDLLAVANRTDGGGRYLFGGQGSSTPPLADTPAGVRFVGSSGELQAAAGEASPLSVDGRAVWEAAPNPKDTSTTVNIFDTLDRAVSDLQRTGRPASEIAQTVSQALGEIDIAGDNLSGWRARAGEALNRIDGIGSRLSAAKLDAQRQRSDAEDLDMLAAISEFQSRQTGYDAALKAYSSVQRMSLFEYIK